LRSKFIDKFAVASYNIYIIKQQIKHMEVSIMKTYKNENYKIVFENESEFTVTNKFGNTYKCQIVNGKITSKSQFGLKYAMAARQVFGF